MTEIKWCDECHSHMAGCKHQEEQAQDIERLRNDNKYHRQLCNEKSARIADLEIEVKQLKLAIKRLSDINANFKPEGE